MIGYNNKNLFIILYSPKNMKHGIKRKFGDDITNGTDNKINFMLVENTRDSYDSGLELFPFVVQHGYSRDLLKYQTDDTYESTIHDNSGDIFSCLKVTFENTRADKKVNRKLEFGKDGTIGLNKQIIRLLVNVENVSQRLLDLASGGQLSDIEFTWD